jgi:Zn-dependent peptidase ImmA (M78 family)
MGNGYQKAGNKLRDVSYRSEDGSKIAISDGCSIPIGNKLVISVNGNDRCERQRFTVCHEIVHAVLELPSEHAGQ